MHGKGSQMRDTTSAYAVGVMPIGVGVFRCGTISMRFAGSAKSPASRRAGWPASSASWTAPVRGAVICEFSKISYTMQDQC